MNNPTLQVPDAARSYLRSAVTTVNCEMSHLSKQVMNSEFQGTTKKLIESWEKLVAIMALGPEPEYRKCPFCNHIGMRSASLCGFCWMKLPPLISPSEA